MLDKNSKIYVLLKIAIILLGIQLVRRIIREVFLQLIGESFIKSDLITLFEMIIFVGIILIISKKQNIKLSIFPKSQSKNNKMGYSITTIIVLFFIISTPIFNGGFSANVIIPLILSTIATPVFEELIFRGYVWNELNHYYKNDFSAYIISTLLFAIWHLGYVDCIWFKMNLIGYSSAVPFAMFMKVITGLCFGIVVGFVRYKFKNCYSSMLAHSFMNIFGR